MADVKENTSTSSLEAQYTSSINNMNNNNNNIFTSDDYMSSTRASIDSDSDYQSSNNNTTSSTTSSQQLQSFISTPSISRPLSRSSSTISGLSTTATKDGVEGKKIHRFQDPMRYISWLKHSSSTVSNNQASLASSSSSNNNNNNGNNTNIDNNYNYTDTISSSNTTGTNTSSSDESTVDSGQQPNYYYSQSSSTKTPPNLPSAPPVTLNEKIRLLRTGSVNGSRKEVAQEYLPPDEISSGVYGGDDYDDSEMNNDMNKGSGSHGYEREYEYSNI